MLNPGLSIPAEATAIPGIENHHVQDAERFNDIAQQLRDFIGALPIIGHNIQFDKRFLNAEFRRRKIKGLGRTKSYCTLQRTRGHFGSLGKGYCRVSLIEAAQLFNIRGRTAEHHDAMEDAHICLQVAAGYYLVDNGLKQPARQSPIPEPQQDELAASAPFPWATVLLIGAAAVLIFVRLIARG